ncbi:MAG: thermonuclease family protein [Epsilonproteobacteria bacterium]|nr:thermonuclease family protein [Campylobacterota bacterium]
MRIIGVLLFGMVVGSLYADPMIGRVVKVADGDTLTILDPANQQHRVRLAQIDAPEKAQPFGMVSKKSLSDICYGVKAQVIPVDIDRYDRIVGTVYCNGTNANLEQIKRGMAWVYDKYAKDGNLYSTQSAARSNKVGLWNDKSPVEPWVFRSSKKQYINNN